MTITSSKVGKIVESWNFSFAQGAREPRKLGL